MEVQLNQSRLLCAFVAAGLTVAPAFADSTKHGEIGFDLGRLNFASEVSDEDATSFGMRGGYNFNRLFLLEGQLSAAEADNPLGDATLSTAFVNGVFNFQLHPRVRPYVLAGVGQANLELEAFGSTIDDTDVAYQLGAGSRFLLGSNKRMSARLEVSRMREETFNDPSNYTNVTTGLSWKLGRRS